MERELPDFREWLIAQCGREDETGALSRGWLEECQDGKTFDGWINSLQNGPSHSSQIEDAQAEHSDALQKLEAGEFCGSYQHGLTLPWIKKMQEKSSEIHRANPGVPPAEYLYSLKRKLYEEFIQGRKIVYLDTNYWIGMRQVYLGDPKSNQVFAKTLLTLIELVNRGKVICPLSLPTFLELLKQTDPRTRVAMSEVITALSDGIALCSIEQLVELEVRRLTARRLGEKFPEFQIWTKNIFVAGEMLPSGPAFTEEQNSWLTRSYIDLQWNLPFSEVVRSSDPAAVWPNWKDMVDAHNRDFAELRKLKLARKDLRDREVALAFHTWGFRDCLTRVAQETVRDYPDLVARSMKQPERGTQKQDLHMIAPAQILGGINAVYVNSGQKILKENDIFDSLHAAFALPYCDIFAGDGGLCHALLEGKNRFDKAYNATVCRNADELLECLSSLE